MSPSLGLTAPPVPDTVLGLGAQRRALRRVRVQGG